MEPVEPDAFNEMYDLVCMGQEDSATTDHRRTEINGGTELRALGAWLERYAQDLRKRYRSISCV